MTHTTITMITIHPTNCNIPARGSCCVCPPAGASAASINDAKIPVKLILSSFKADKSMRGLPFGKV
jgi:hypothetical protein